MLVLAEWSELLGGIQSVFFGCDEVELDEVESGYVGTGFTAKMGDYNGLWVAVTTTWASQTGQEINS